MEMITRTELVRIYPNARMKTVIDALCDYRRYCWNQGLALWNAMYDSSLVLEDKTLHPNERKVRDELVANKADWQYNLSARCLQLAISDLAKAWENFFNKAQPDWGKPQFKSKKSKRQGFKTDRARLVNGMLRLDKPRGVTDWYDIPISKNARLSGELKLASLFKEGDKYHVALVLKDTVTAKKKTQRSTGIDLNVNHIDYIDGSQIVCPKRLDKLYSRIKHYQRQLTKKREVNGIKATQSHNYVKTKAKLQRDYNRVAAIQKDLLHKLTTQLVTDYDKLVIEDLDVKGMMMSHVASKGLHRSLFGQFRQMLTYKCEWYGKELIVAPRSYPSTQRCSDCGHIKTGDDKITLQGNAKHGTKHNEYICYQCGAVKDRDYNAVLNLLALA